MKGKTTKTVLGIIILILALIVVGLISSRRPSHDDYGTFKKMRMDYLQAFNKLSLREREVNKYWVDYTLQLGFLFSVVLDSDEIELHIKAFEGEELDNVAYSQFNFAPGKEEYMDFTFMAKPSPKYNAPFIHGDAMAPMTGFKGLFHMDFYTFDPKTFNMDHFFGDQLGKIKKALKIVEKYQKTEEAGRHKLTRHLDAYKSKYRIELLEPQSATEEERKIYFKAVYDSCFLYVDAYCTAMSRQRPLSSNKDIDKNIEEMGKFMMLLDEKDIAAKLGRMLFPKDDFKIYFFDTFWNTQLPGG